MKRYVSPNSSWRFSSRFTICAWIETSSAETGSSQTTSDGFSASARARPTRWRCPPENSCGYRFAASGGQPDDLEDLPHPRRDLPAPRDAVHAERLADRAPDGVARVERRERILEDHLHPPPQLAQLRLGQVRDVGSLEEDAAARWLVEPEHRPPDGRLAAPGLADEPDGLAAADRQGDAVDGLDVADVAVEDDAALDGEPDAEVVQLDERPGVMAVPAHAASPPTRARCHSSGAAGLKHAARWPVSSCSSCGSSSMQRSSW